jgi:hypothetical protein
MGNTLMSLLIAFAVDNSDVASGIQKTEAMVNSSMKSIGSSVTNVPSLPPAATNSITKFKDAIKSTTSPLNQLSQGLFGLNLSSLVGIGGIIALIGFEKQAVDSTMSLAKEVRDLSRDIGDSPTDVSKLIAAADAAEISVSDLKSAMVIANTQGIDVTYAGMLKLAGQYNAIQNPLERTRFLTDTFGRSGEKMGALMAMGAAGIKAAGDEAAKYGNILDSNAIAKTEEFRQVSDNLKDALAGVKPTRGLAVIPELTKASKALNLVLDVGIKNKDWITGLPEPLQKAIGMVKGLVDIFNAAINPIKNLINLLASLYDLTNTTNSA